MNVVQYARVSSEMQDADDKVSIDQQQAEMRALCERNAWQSLGVYVDNEKYKATQTPKRGKVVNPSGERADRPQFLAMLEMVKKGDVDAVLCWRDDRLVRHPRVAVALEDALDVGDTRRNGRPKIEIRDATGAMLDRFTLSIKATIWREENKRRVERTRLGKVATLNQNRYPGQFRALGLVSIKEPGKRGRKIEIVEDEAHWVRNICQWFYESVSVQQIRQRLIAEGAEQTGIGNKRHEWGLSQIYDIVRAEYYTGKLAWRFADGTEYAIDIPPIIDRELWERNRERMKRNKFLSTRNAGGVYLLLGVLHCGECGRKMHAEQQRFYYKRGKKQARQTPRHIYRCPSLQQYPEEPHPRPYHRVGRPLDWQVWRHIVDFCIKRPEAIREQLQRRRAELQAQGGSADGDISHARRRLTEIDRERARYQRKYGQDKMTEAEFDARMDETMEARRYWRAELERLQSLRDDTEKVQAGMDYARKFLTGLQRKLQAIDQSPEELKELPEKRQREIMKARQRIIRALCQKVLIYANGQVKIEGVLDGSELAQFELASRTSGSTIPTCACEPSG